MSEKIIVESHKQQAICPSCKTVFNQFIDTRLESEKTADPNMKEVISICHCCNAILIYHKGVLRMANGGDLERLLPTPSSVINFALQVIRLKLVLHSAEEERKTMKEKLTEKLSKN